MFTEWLDEVTDQQLAANQNLKRQRTTGARQLTADDVDEEENNGQYYGDEDD